MSGKPFPRVILIAHGSGTESSDRAWRTRLLDAVKPALPEFRVDMAFIKGTPDINTVLNPADRDILILPLCLADGFFYRKLIPDALTAIPEKTTIQCLPPLYQRRAELMQIIKEAAFHTCPSDLRTSTRLLAVSHGSETGGETNAAISTSSLRQNIPGFGDYGHVFLKKSPSLLEWTEQQQEGDTLALPCFLMEGKHTMIDIPTILGIPVGQSAFGAHPSPRGVIRYAPPIGINPGIANLVIRAIKER